MGNASDKSPPLDAESRHSLECFSPKERTFVITTFKDLADMSKSGTEIDKKTFRRKYPLPGLLGERLFAEFDTNHSGTISFDEFVRGFSVACKGTPEQKMKLVFRLCDAQGKGAITKDELKTLLNHVPKCFVKSRHEATLDQPSRHGTLSNGDSGSHELDAPESCNGNSNSAIQSPTAASGNYTSHFDPQYSLADEWLNSVSGHSVASAYSRNLDDSRHFNSRNLDDSRHSLSSNAPGLDDSQCNYKHHYNEFTNNDTIDAIFEECDLDNDGQLVYEEFRIWMEKNPAVTESVELQAGVGHILGIMLGGFARPSEQLPQGLRKIFENHNVNKSGTLYKQGHRLHGWVQRWFAIIGNSMYYNNQSKDAKAHDVQAKGVIFLIGSQVRAIEDKALERKGYWGFEITRKNEHKHRRKLFTKSESERDSWVHELQRACEVVPIENDYKIGAELGVGKFSSVKLATHLDTGIKRAVKIINKGNLSHKDKELLRCEISIMNLVNHPNVIHMVAVYEDVDHIYMVMELHNGGELYQRICGRACMKEDEAFTVIYAIVEGVAYLHEMGIVHRDIKPENILCGEEIGDIRIADFGLSQLVMPEELMNTPCGTISYVAPEVCAMKDYGRPADIYSIGVIMYLILNGKLPFDGDTVEETIHNTINAELDTSGKLFKALSPDCQDLLKNMLSKDPKDRLTAKEILLHPWVTSRLLVEDPLVENIQPPLPPIREHSFRSNAEEHHAT